MAEVWLAVAIVNAVLLVVHLRNALVSTWDQGMSVALAAISGVGLVFALDLAGVLT